VTVIQQIGGMILVGIPLVITLVLFWRARTSKEFREMPWYKKLVGTTAFVLILLCVIAIVWASLTMVVSPE
jgi:hypothetical protein